MPGFYHKYNCDGLHATPIYASELVADVPALGDASTIVIFLTNSLPITPSSGATLTLQPSGKFTVGADSLGHISVTLTLVGCDAGGNTAAPDGFHFLITGGGGTVLNFSSGWWGQQLSGLLAVIGGDPTDVDFDVQIAGTWASSDDIPPVDDGAILPPSDLTAAVTGGDHVQLDWTDNSSNEKGFIIERSDDGDWFQIASVPPGFTTFDDYGVFEGSHSWRVYAWKSDAISSNSNVASIGDGADAAAIFPTEVGILGKDDFTITGSNFVDGATVTIGGAAATEVIVVNGTTITGKTPAHAEGFVDVVITNPDTSTVTMPAALDYLSYITAPILDMGPAQKVSK